MRIILGSQSPRRLEILRSVVPPGHTVELMPPDIDEKAIRYPNPSALTLAIARAKNEAVRAVADGDSVIVTADTVAVWDGTIREKPQSGAELREFVKSYRDSKVTAVTSVWVHRTNSGWDGSVTDTADTHFSWFTNQEVDAIVMESAFYGSAGGFLIEHPLMKHRVLGVVGDPDTVQGLPGRLVRLLVRDALAS